MDDLIERGYLIGKFEDTGPPALSEMGKGYDLGIKAALRVVKKAPAVNRWIPCSERMPENRERVLVCFRSGTVHIAVWYGDYDEKGAWKVTSQFPTKLYRTDTIPKWMPMPDAYEPPKEGDNNDQG